MLKDLIFLCQCHRVQELNSDTATGVDKQGGEEATPVANTTGWHILPPSTVAINTLCLTSLQFKC